MGETTDDKSLRVVDDAATLGAMCDFIQSLSSTIVNILRYPPGSAVVVMAIDRCEKSLAKIFETRTFFSLTESERILLVDLHPLAENIQVLAYIRSFVDSMVARGIRSLTFKKNLSREEILSFLYIVGEKPAEMKKKGLIADQLKARDVKNIFLDEKAFYVAISKDEGVAKISELDRLSKLDKDMVSLDQIKDGFFLRDLLSKVPRDRFGVGEEQIDELKRSIGFDSLKDAQKIDFDKVGPAIARSMEQWSKADQVDEGKAARDLDKVTPAEEEADKRVRRIAKTFEEMSKAILEFKQPEIRAKLVTDFMRVVTNFKGLTLAKILSARLSGDKDLDLKEQIIQQISAKKKSIVVDLLYKKYHRLAEGLSAGDFNISLEELSEGEGVLKKLMRLARAKEDQDFAAKLKRALGLTRMLTQEARTPQALLVLKIKRLFTKGPEVFIEEDLISNFRNVAGRLIEAGRPDVIRRIIDKMAQNFTNVDPEVRLKTVAAFVRVNQDVIELKRPKLLNEAFGLLIKQLKSESDQAVFTRIMAVVVTDFGKVLDLGDYTLASNILRALQRRKKECPEGVKKQILGEAIAKLSGDEESLVKILEAFKSDDQKTSEAVAALLRDFPTDKVLHLCLMLLKESEDMRVRKKCIAFLGSYQKKATDSILAHLIPSEPWFFNRNLINLLGDTADGKAVERIASFLNDPEERLRKAAISTLAKFGDKDSEARLVETFEEQPFSVQKILVHHFGRSRTLSAASRLITQMEKSAAATHDETYLISIIEALGRIGALEAAPAIARYLNKSRLRTLFHKPGDDLIAAALSALGHIGDEAFSGVVKKYLKHATPGVSRAAQKSFEQLSSAEN